MSYCIYIERENNAITLDEWKHAVSKVKGVKIHTGPIEGINPLSKKIISISNTEGSVEVLFKSRGFFGIGSSEEWITAIHYHNGHARLNATEEIENPKNPIRKAASSLAKILNAKIVGEAGEEYNW